MRKWLIRIAIVLVVLFGAYHAFHQLYFLRLPERNVPNDASVFVSPADGLVYAVKEWDQAEEIVPKDLNGAIKVMTDGLGSKGTLVSITLNLHNIHYQRAMIQGRYLSSEYKKGEFNNALVHENEYGMRFENEHNVMLFESSKGTKYKVIQLAGFAARRIVDFMAEKGGPSDVKQGDVISVIKLGSQVTVIFPEGVEVLAKPGDRVIDGETILARERQ